MRLCIKKTSWGRVTYYNEKWRYHRTDGPALIEPQGTKSWYHNGNLHRLDGPAIESPDGSRHWYVNGNPHRVGGPAKMWASWLSDEYWIDGERVGYVK